jgi:hypothetical protein
MNEIGPAGIPFSVVTKAAEIQFLDVVDKALLGNKWLRKAAGIQPQFPYVVDSFEERCRCNAVLFLLLELLMQSMSTCGGILTGQTELGGIKYRFIFLIISFQTIIKHVCYRNIFCTSEFRSNFHSITITSCYQCCLIIIFIYHVVCHFCSLVITFFNLVPFACYILKFSIISWS